MDVESSPKPGSPEKLGDDYDSSDGEKQQEVQNMAVDEPKVEESEKSDTRRKRSKKNRRLVDSDEEEEESSSSEDDDDEDGEYSEEKPANSKRASEKSKEPSSQDSASDAPQDSETPKGRGKASGAKRKSKQPAKKDEGDEKKPEVKTVVDGIMERKRAQKTKALTDEEKIEMATDLLKVMWKAYQKDRASRRAKQPALEKLSKLDEVVRRLSDRRISNALTDVKIPVNDGGKDGSFGVGDLLVAWLKPGRAQIPNEKLRTKLFGAIDGMGFNDGDLIRSSKIGKILNFYRCHPEETLDNKRLTNAIISRWMDMLKKEHQ